MRAMKPGDTVYVGDGAYLHYTGYSFEFRANHHEHPTDRVSIDFDDAWAVLQLIRATIMPELEGETEVVK